MDRDPIDINRRTYDAIAASFAARRANMVGGLIEIITRLKARVPAGEWVLDLGCGAGRDLAWMEAAGMRAVGADLSAGMLAEARKITRAGLWQMEMRWLGFAGQCFAAVWCDAALLHLPKQQVPAALAEVARVLVPGGRFFVLVQQGSGEGLETNETEHATRFYARYQAEELAQLLEQAGFHIIEQGAYENGRTWLWYETIWPGTP